MKELQSALQVLERNPSLPPAGVIFDGKPVARVLVSSEVRRAGVLTAQARKRNNVPVYKLAPAVGIGARRFNSFEARRENLELGQVYTGMSVYLDEQDGGMREIEKLRNNQMWFRTVAQENMSLGDIIERMCLADWSIPTRFAKKAGITHTEDINYYIADATTPREKVLNDLIRASVIDSESKAAKLTRLKREGQKPKRLAEFRVSSIPTDIKDLRLMYGLSAAELGEKLHYSGRSILYFENGDRKINKNVLRAYANGLGIPEDSPLLWSLFFKLNNPKVPLPSQVLPLVFDEERLLFQEHVGQILPYPVSAEDRELLDELKSKRRAGVKLAHIRAKYKLPARTSVDIDGSASSTEFDHSEIVGKIPEGITVLKLMKLTGRDLHNPVSDDLLRTAKRERQKRYKRYGAKPRQKAA